MNETQGDAKNRAIKKAEEKRGEGPTSIKFQGHAGTAKNLKSIFIGIIWRRQGDKSWLYEGYG
ncbi:hypothetical protein KFK09_021260 [Dendrobium nobile]|uniref:Uncharacterized protein n=1 Tax=Dendrobium nobile TaxID=94219 RepID=A0A8T3ANS5_DENNO|nr:hypothetical protein KFK09_021260 [Dendrobium nobile]